MSANVKRTVVYVGLTYLLSYLLVALFLAFGGRWNQPSAFILAVVYMFTPMVATITIQRLIVRKPLWKPLGVSFHLNKWFLVAWLLPLVVAIATLGVSLLFPGVDYAPGMEGLLERFGDMMTPEQLQQAKEQLAALPGYVFWIALAQSLIVGASVNALFAFGEEIGWRGFLLKELGYLGFWRSSAVIGVVWGLWHAPLVLLGHNYPQHPVAGVLMMTVFAVLLSPIFTYIAVRAASVIAAAVLHGSLNATAGLSLMVIKGGSDLTVGVTGLAGFLVLALVNIVLFFLKAPAMDQFQLAGPDEASPN